VFPVIVSVAIRFDHGKMRAPPLWSAVTRHRFDRFGDLSPKQSRAERLGE